MEEVGIFKKENVGNVSSVLNEYMKILLSNYFS
jgi:hypothetical protein